MSLMRLLASWPIFFALTVLCLVAQENYPFSNFPMYSSFAPKSYLVYLADATGQPLPTFRFGLSTADLKKVFNSKRQPLFRLEKGAAKPKPATADRIAGAEVLRHLEKLPAVRGQRPSLLPGLQVRRVDLRWKNGRIETETTTIAQHP